MRIYGTFLCPDCGCETTKTSPNTKRCKPCALKAHGQTGSGFAEKVCCVCSKPFKPNSASQKACAECAPAFKQEQNRKNLERLRRERGAIPVGTVLNCPECNEDFAYRSGPQHRCPDCQKKAEVRKIHEWLASNKDRLNKYITKAKDNYSFGGNREAALNRDNFTCQHCGSNDDLHVHHIDGNGVTTPKESRNNALDNLITLCRGCHTKEHHRLRHSSCAPQIK